jgi:hypothetical protein
VCVCINEIPTFDILREMMLAVINDKCHYWHQLMDVIWCDAHLSAAKSNTLNLILRFFVPFFT